MAVAVDLQTVARWLDAYVRAWETYDADAIAALFSEDATYAWHPWDELPVRGRAAIVKAWLEHRDAPGTYKAHYTPLTVDGNLAVATGMSTYYDAAGAIEHAYCNCFVMGFDQHGRCTSST